MLPQAACPSHATRAPPCAVYSTTHPDYYELHYQQPKAEADAQYRADLDEACTKFEYSDFRILKAEPGADANEANVAFTYKWVRRRLSECVRDAVWAIPQHVKGRHPWAAHSRRVPGVQLSTCMPPLQEQEERRGGGQGGGDKPKVPLLESGRPVALR